MRQIDDATRRQLEAASPYRSTWLSANAGSGKTRVLTDRVARLLLEGVQPQHILCLTYTKAAASEMQNRLFKRLGEWAMLDDSHLHDTLAELGVTDRFDEPSLRMARTLFARAIETPGGLKIQTIHSFCGALLRRFPLEAGVSPQFVEIEERASELLRAEIVDEMAAGTDAPLVMGLAETDPYKDLLSLTDEIVREQVSFRTVFDRAALLKSLGQPNDLAEEQILGRVLGNDSLEFIQHLAEILKIGGKKDAENSQFLQQITVIDDTTLPLLESAFLTQGGTRHKRAATKAVAEAYPDAFARLNDLMDRVEQGREARLALALVDRSERLHHFARRFLQRYTQAKQDRGWLDFDDLIAKAQALLSDPRVAAWVLFRIDGGIDHVLVDEAQDTGPGQWDVIRRLSEEFAAGQGARSDVRRTIFVVGDQKQSIYSFQGADPKAFEMMRDEFDTRLRDTGTPLQQTALEYSFRSSPAILQLVDRVFEDEAGQTFPASTGHIAFQNALPGRVDIWPVVPPVEKPTPDAWFDAVDRKSDAHHHKVLAQKVADQISGLLGSAIIPTKAGEGRPVQAKDIMILVRRRTGIFQEIIRACKEAGLPIAGSDRLKVGAEVAVKDLRALLSFLALADDDLSLAVALRSPLFGWSEQELFTLAHHRGKQTLWAALREQEETHPETIAILRDLRDRVDFLRPYDLIERMLTRHQGRKRLIGRLGPEAEDGIDAFLSQALSYEQTSIPSLTGFLVWMETDDLTIKRQIDSATDQIRIMTVHGSKGLESPIVILPECEKRQYRERGSLRTLDDQTVWLPSSKQRPAALATITNAARTIEEEEALRLLYVALTRAEKWLIVGASGEIDEKTGSDWYSRVERAARACGAEDLGADGGLRLSFGDWNGLEVTKPDAIAQQTSRLDQHFQHPAKRPDPKPKTLSPSSLQGEKALPGDGFDEETAKRYGTFIHLLLERLPDMRPSAQETFVARTAERLELTRDLAAQAVAETSRIFSDPSFASLFHPGTLAEVAVTAPFGKERLHGTIDRLIVTDNKVLAVDFKSNRHLPDRPEACPKGILRQLGAYALALEQIYPDREIETAVLWTSAPRLMRFSHDIVRQALFDPRYLDGPNGAT